ncbi:MAG TPA: TlpA disulfide reductase family protein, partial [Nitrosopumilaceae archaeon]|nr:TlpA disulfide reductase family protein [Nitrosopumilaceae archaeon]
ENKKIATNILRLFRKLQPGAEVPDFRLMDVKGNEHSPGDFKGKYIYLEFFASWNTSCLQEMKKLEKIENQYGDKIVFISISVDDSLKDFVDFTKKNPKYNWLLLYAGKDKLVKEKYDIKSVPAYFLINREGYLVLSPAPMPSEGIEFKFRNMFKEKKR